MNVRSQYGHGYTFPCLFHVGENGWALISETGVDSKYCGSHLSDATADGDVYKRQGTFRRIRLSHTDIGCIPAECRYTIIQTINTLIRCV